MTSIVTTTYRYKRQPRKKKPIVLTGSAIVTPKAQTHTPASEPQASSSVIVRRAKPGNDNRPAEQPSAIVTITSKRRRKPLAEPPDDSEADARVKAFLARMIRSGGPLPPDASE